MQRLVQQRPYLRADRVETPPLPAEELRHGKAHSVAELNAQRVTGIEAHVLQPRGPAGSERHRSHDERERYAGCLRPIEKDPPELE